MEIFFQSRGISQDNGFRWIDQNNNSKEPSGELEGTSSFIDSQYYSILLRRQGQKLILLITAMWAESRTDFAGRRIRNSVLWIADNQEEKKIRSLLIQALRDEERFSQNIDQSVSLGGQYEFTVAFEKLEQLASSDLDNIGDQSYIKKTFKFGGDSQNLREELEKELQENKFPLDDQNIFILTTIKSQKSLEEIKFWRGLSNKVEAEELIEIEMPNKLASIQTAQYESTSEKNNKDAAFFLIIFVLFCLAIIGILLGKLLINPEQENPSTNQEKTQVIKQDLDVLTCQKAIQDGYFLSPCIPKL